MREIPTLLNSIHSLYLYLGFCLLHAELITAGQLDVGPNGFTDKVHIVGLTLIAGQLDVGLNGLTDKVHIVITLYYITLL